MHNLQRYKRLRTDSGYKLRRLTAPLLRPGPSKAERA